MVRRAFSHGLGRTWLDRIVEDLINSLDILVGGRVQDDNDSSDQADGAPQFAQCSKLFTKKVRAEHGSYENGQGTKRCDENRRCERICGEVEDLSENHCQGLSAITSCGLDCLGIPVQQEMPAHQRGLRK